MQKVWITGAGGLIGSHLVRSAGEFAPGLEVVGLTRTQLDLTDFEACCRLFEEQRPTLVIHCAALSKSPACQADPKLAWRLNFEVTRFLTELAADIPFIFFSSDLVFDGRKGNYVETDLPNPLSVYAETKLAAERAVLTNLRHTVVRTSLNGGASPSGASSFNEELRRAWVSGQTLTLFTDEFRCPIPAAVTAQAIWELVAVKQPGLYHLAGAEKLSRYQIGQLIAARWPSLHPKIAPGSIQDFRGAPRAPDTSLNCDKIQRLLTFPLPGLTSWLNARVDEAV